MARVVVELLTKAHDRKRFDCGKLEQNEFLKQRARKHAELNYSRTWVAVEEGQSEILGYVTLSMGNIVFENLTDELRAKLPRYPMPVLHVGQLATAASLQGREIGSPLLRFASEKAIEASATVGCFAIELVADNQKAFDWYLRRGFFPRPSARLRLYQSVETLKLAAGFASGLE